MKNEDKKAPTIILPLRLVTSVDLARVARELKTLDDWLTQAGLRQTGKPVSAPKTSTTLEELAAANNVSLLEAADRERLIALLADFSEHAPRIHMSFAVEPSASFLNRMIVWLRTNINPHILLEIGLQPTLAAGCSVRTVNKMFDLSLRHRFVDSRPLLVQSIAKFQNEIPQGEALQASPAPETVPAAAPQPQASKTSQQPEAKPVTQEAAK